MYGWRKIGMKRFCETDFSSTNLIFRDYHDDRCHWASIMVSTATEILHDPSLLPAQLSHGSSFLTQGCDCHV